MQPVNLRILPRSEWSGSHGDKYNGTVIQFDGDSGNDYRLFARSKSVHGHQPLVDDPTGKWVWVDDPNGREVKRVNGEWVRNADGSYKKGRYELIRRRTWTQIGGYEQGTKKSRTLANVPMDVIFSDLPGSGPWQLMIDDRRDPTGETHSNMVECEAQEQLKNEKQDNLQNDHKPEPAKQESPKLKPPERLLKDVTFYSTETRKGAVHVSRWKRTLAAFGVLNFENP